MNGRTRILLRIIDGQTSQELARVHEVDGADPTVVILRSGGKVAREEPITGDVDQSFTFRAVKGVSFGIHASEISRAIGEGRQAIPLDHPSSPRAVIGYRTEDKDTERAAEVHLSAEQVALDVWRAKGSEGMVRFFESRVEDARQRLARIRRDTPKGKRKR